MLVTIEKLVTPIVSRRDLRSSKHHLRLILTVAAGFLLSSDRPLGVLFAKSLTAFSVEVERW
jgi:hypothetical protein